MIKRNIIIYQFLESFIYYILMSNLLTLIYIENFIKPNLGPEDSSFPSYLSIYKSETNLFSSSDYLFSLSFSEILICLLILYLLRYVYGTSKMFLLNLDCVGTFIFNEKLYFNSKLSKMKYTFLKPLGIINLIWLLNSNYRSKLGILIKSDIERSNENE